MLMSHRQLAIRHSPHVMCQVWWQGIGTDITLPVSNLSLSLQPSSVLWPVAMVSRCHVQQEVLSWQSGLGWLGDAQLLPVLSWSCGWGGHGWLPPSSVCSVHKEQHR